MPVAWSSPYDQLARVYDLLGTLYTAGGIRGAKRQHVAYLTCGQRVLYVGAGTGEECLLAAQAGADVTIIERSHEMLKRCRKRFAESGWSAHFVHDDALRLVPTENFDVVVAPFFLNTLAPKELPSALEKLESYVCQGGRFVSVDFRGPSESGLFRLLQRLFYLPPLLLFWAIAGNPWHNLYDYCRISEAACPKWAPGERQMCRAWGLPLLETITWRVS